MDNFQIDVVAEGEKTLVELFEIAFRHNSAGGTAVAWNEVEIPFKGVEYLGDTSPTRPTLVFYWHYEEKEKTVRLPSPISPTLAARFAMEWISELKRVKRLPNEPDIDGSVGHGFRVFTEDWGHVQNNGYAIIAVQFVWATYGK